MKKIPLLLLPILVLGAIAVGCGGGGSKKTVNLPGGGQVSTSNKLPSNFPSSFPQYEGASVQGSYSGSQGGITGTVVSWTTGDSVDKVTQFYNDAFKSGSSWASTANGTANGSSYWVADSSDGKNTAYVGVSTASGKTMISAVVAPKESSSSSGGASTSTSSGSSDTPTSSSSDNTPSSEATTSSSEPLPTEVSLSSDFPAGRVPFPSGARVTSDSSFSSNGTKTSSVDIYVKDTASNVSDYFKNEMPRHNWTNALTSSTNGQYFLQFTGATGESLSINVQDSGTSGYAKATLVVVVSG